jgi:hypothetical protein
MCVLKLWLKERGRNIRKEERQKEVEAKRNWEEKIERVNE